MEKLYRNEWEDVIHKAAMDAARAYVKFVKSNSASAPAKGLEESQYNKISAFLKEKYPYDTVTNDDMDVLSNFSSDDVWKWQLYRDEYDPRRKHEAAELVKFLPFLEGVADEGQGWMDGRQDLKMKAAELGFDYSQEGLAQFLEKLRKYQGVYDRAQLMKEMRDDPRYWPMKVAYPSLMEGIENAVSTGGDLSASDAAKLGVLDAATNAAMFEVPGAGSRIVSNPIAAGVLDAALQGGIELHRQGAKTFIDPTLEDDPAQALAAAAFGASRPGIVGTLQAGVAKIPGKEAMAISRGISKSTRAGNPLENERDTIRELVRNHNGVIRGNRDFLKKTGARVYKFDNDGRMTAGYAGGILANRSVADTERMLGTSRVDEMARLLGVEPERNGTYDVEKFMAAYDRKPVYSWEITGNSTRLVNPAYKSSDRLFQLSPENKDLYRSLFPAKYADEAQASRLRTAGLVLGRVAGDFGGKFEPTFKLNPLNVGPQNFPGYTRQDWYTRLGPKAQAIIDEAFKKKGEEEEQEVDRDALMGL